MTCLCFCVVTQATLAGFVRSWKTVYTSMLADEALKAKNAAIDYMARVQEKLNQPVMSLEQLNETVAVLEEIRNMENNIDSVYRPLEDAYNKLAVYDGRYFSIVCVVFMSVCSCSRGLCWICVGTRKHEA